MFNISLTPEAQQDILRFDPSLQTRLLDRIEWLGDNAELIRHQALQGDEWRGCFKYCAGDYRIVYRLDHSAKKLVILKVGHRRQVYR